MVAVTYYVIATAKPSYLSILLTIQPARYARFSKLVTLYRPAVISSRSILNWSLRYSVPLHWSSLRAGLRCPKDSGSQGTSLLSKSTFVSKLKTHPLHNSCYGSSKSASAIPSSRSNLSYLASPWTPG